MISPKIDIHTPSKVYLIHWGTISSMLDARMGLDGSIRFSISSSLVFWDSINLESRCVPNRGIDNRVSTSMEGIGFTEDTLILAALSALTGEYITLFPKDTEDIFCSQVINIAPEVSVFRIYIGLIDAVESCK